MSNTSDEQLWPPTWARAALGTAVLASLAQGPLHGYGIAQAVSERGFGRPKGGSLYPLLTALESDGAVVAQWEEGQNGPGKRNYALTPLGRVRLAAEREAWRTLVASLHDDHELSHHTDDPGAAS